MIRIDALWLCTAPVDKRCGAERRLRGTIASTTQRAHRTMADVITERAFIPVAGKCFELHFGKITVGKETGYVIAKVRIEPGNGIGHWIDLDTGAPIDPRIAKYVVQGYREIDCP